MIAAYEDEKLAAEYLLLHYGTEDELLPFPFGPKESLFFPVRSVRELTALELLPLEAHALDLGCAVGRSSFELTRYCASVVGADFSDNFIRIAQELKKKGLIRYSITEEGSRRLKLNAVVPQDISRSKVQFIRADAHALPFTKPFDIIHLANLLCRLKQPKSLLLQLPELVVPGGQLIITTPATWLESFTPPEFWLGGSPQAPLGTTLDSLHEILGRQFRLDYIRDMPLLIRETKRKYQWIVSQGTRWVRTA